MDLFFCLVFAVPLYASVLVQALIYVQALVFDLAQLTCQKRFDCDMQSRGLLQYS